MISEIIFILSSEYLTMMRIMTYIFFCAVALAALVFACLNADPVSINYYIGSNKLPLSLLMVVSFITGCLLTLVISMLIVLRLKKENLILQGRVKLAEKEVANLRSLPLQDSH